MHQVTLPPPAIAQTNRENIKLQLFSKLIQIIFIMFLFELSNQLALLNRFSIILHRYAVSV